MLVLAFVVLGAVEQCQYLDTDTSDAIDSCATTLFSTTCETVEDKFFHLCVPTFELGNKAAGVQYTCSADGSVVKIQYHKNSDCSDDVSTTECVLALDATTLSLSGCSQTYKIDECTELKSTGNAGYYAKHTGSCPKADDGGTCFSREAEACRILDIDATPSAAFRACFDEPAPSTVAERVKMTALTGGDYVLSAGKGLAYEFTRVIVNQHKLNEARR